MNDLSPVILALSAPRVPSTEANGGLNWVDLYEDPEAKIPVQIVIPIGNEILAGDRIDLNWENATLASRAVDDTDLQTRIVTFLIRALDIIPLGDGQQKVNFLVTAAVGGGQSRSPDLTVRVKTLVPGGTDPDAGTPYINERLSPPEGIPDLIDDSVQSLTVTVQPYENMDKDDIVALDWGGQRLSPSSPLEVGNPITFVVPRTVLENSAGNVIVRYQIRDLVNNWSKWSLHKDTDVEVGNSFLQAPRVSGVGVVSGQVDLALLGINDLQVDIPVYTMSTGQGRYAEVSDHPNEQQPFMESGDKIQLVWSGHTAEGTVLPDILVDYEIQASDLGWPISLKVPNAQVKLIASGYATMRYTVTPLVGAPKYSRRANVPVIGDVQSLPPPQVLESTGSILDPDTLPASGATLHIDTSELFANGDFVHVQWNGTKADGSALLFPIDILITAGMVGKPIESFVDRLYVDPLINGTVDISYALNKGDGPVSNSPVTTLQIRNNSAQLPAPIVDYAVGEQLDPADVPANGTTLRVNYTPMVASELVTVQWAGKLPFSDSFTIPPSWNNKEIPFHLAKSYVDGNLNETVQVYYTVTANESTRTSLSQSLTIGAGAPSELIEDFGEHDTDLISAGGSINTKHMTIRFVSGTGTAGFAPGYVLPPAASSDFINPVLQVSYQNRGTQTLQLELKTDSTSVTCDVHGVEANSTNVRFLDANQNELNTQLLPKQTNQKVAYATTTSARIRYIEISSQNDDWTLWDNFVMKT